VIYLDTSALLRGLLPNAIEQTEALAVLNNPSISLISSELLWLEADRTALRIAKERPAHASIIDDVKAALARVAQLVIDREVITAARAIPEVVKSLDAIHIASAEILSADLECVLTYDKTMSKLLTVRGVPVYTAAEWIASRGASHTE
jgi:predicted nucleic acid-binding protein